MNLTLKVIIILHFTSKLVSNYKLAREEVTQISTPGFSKFQNEIEVKVSYVDLNKDTKERNHLFAHKYQRWKKAPMFKCIQQNSRKHILPKITLSSSKDKGILNKRLKQVTLTKLGKSNSNRNSLFGHEKSNWFSGVTNYGNGLREWEPATESLVEVYATDRLYVDVLNTVDINESTSSCPLLKPTYVPCSPVKHRVTAAISMMITPSYDEEPECKINSFSPHQSTRKTNDVVVINAPCKLGGCPVIVVTDKNNESFSLTFRKNVSRINHRPSAKFRSGKTKIVFEDTDPNYKTDIIEELLRNRYYLSAEQYKNRPELYFPRDKVAEKLDRLEKTGFISKWKPETLSSSYQKKLKAFYAEAPSNRYSLKLKSSLTKIPSNNLVVSMKHYPTVTTRIPVLSKSESRINVTTLNHLPSKSKSLYETRRKSVSPIKSAVRKNEPYRVAKTKDLTNIQSDINKKLIENLIQLMKKKIITRELGNDFNLNKL